MILFTLIPSPKGNLFLFLFLAFFCATPQLRAQGETDSSIPYAVFLEPECALVGENWAIEEDSLASGGSYVVIKPGFVSVANPPTDLPANLLSFTLDVQEGDFFNLYARVDANAPDNDSFWIRVNGGAWVVWNSNISNNRMWGWRQVTGNPFYMPAGEVKLDFAYREADTKLDKIFITSLQLQQPTGLGGFSINCDEETSCAQFPESCTSEVWIESECANLGSRWRYLKSTMASNGGYVFAVSPSEFSTPEDGDTETQLTYDAELTEDGTYYLWMRLNARDAARNSVYVRIDDQPWTVFGFEIGGADLSTDGFEWRLVNVQGDSTKYDLTAGSHTISVASRENSTILDKIALTRSAEAPTGYGKVSLNCQVNDATPVRTVLDVESKLSVFPNPATATLHLQLDGEITGAVQVSVVDVNGRRVSTRVYQKSSAMLTDEIDVAQLPSGVYSLVVTSGSGLITRPFVKR